MIVFVLVVLDALFAYFNTAWNSDFSDFGDTANITKKGLTCY